MLHSSLPCQKRCCKFEDIITRLKGSSQSEVAFQNEITTHAPMFNTLLNKETFLTIANHEKNRLIIVPNHELHCLFQKKEEDERFVSLFILLFLFTLRAKENNY